MALPEPSTYPKPPGQERQCLDPSRTGTVRFQVPGQEQDLQGETFYAIYGSLASDKVPVICLHGGPGFPHNHMRPISLISSDYGIPVVMYDQIGCGASTRFPDRMGDTSFWTPELFMAELENLTRALGITRFDLLGHSWGGMLAGQYAAARQPSGLRKLVICDSPAAMTSWSEVANALRRQLPQDAQDALDRGEREGKRAEPAYKEAMNLFFQRHTIRIDPMPKDFKDSIAASGGDRTVYLTMNGPSEFQLLGSLKTWDITEDLRRLTPETVPGGMLLVNGLFDQAQDECMMPYFKQPSARVRWIQFGLSSHCPHLEETEKFLRVVGEFLSD